MIDIASFYTSNNNNNLNCTALAHLEVGARDLVCNFLCSEYQCLVSDFFYIIVSETWYLSMAVSELLQENCY